MLDELAVRAARRPAVVLDDDPTGTQTLRDVPVLTAWTPDSIARWLDQPVVFLSTNSRSLEEAAAVELAREGTTAALDAARRRGVPISLVSRSDSTLRGHFPAETRAIADAAGMPDARTLLAPFFGEGGRLTIGDVHYLEHDGRRTPVGETEFARDRAFGYRSSDLREWVVEKYAGAGLLPPPLASLSLGLLREGGPQAVSELLLDLPPRAVIIANAENDADIETVALGAVMAEETGLPLLARVAASYVRARAGRPVAPLLDAAELGVSDPGLVIVGSHVETTTRQLASLRERQGSRLTYHELSVGDSLADPGAAAERGAAEVAVALRAGRSAVIFTERRRAELGLEQGRSLSRTLAAIVGRLAERPGWVLAKGGITSSDVALDGLEMREARVAGQLLPGVPVWIGLDDARWPGLPLIVFPGNVGGPSALADAVAALTGRPSERPTMHELR